MKKKIDNVRRQLLDKLSEESIMVLETAYVYAKNYVLYGGDITKSWTTAVQQAAILEQVRVKAFTDAYDSFKKDYENRLKADMVAMLSEIQLEIEEEKQDTKHLHYNDLENAESYNNGIDNCIDIIQQKIDKCKAESEVKANENEK